MLTFIGILLACAGLAWGQGQIPNADLWECTEAVWQADTNSFPATELEYDLTRSPLFSAINGSRLTTGTYPSYLALLDGFNPNLGETDPDLTVEIDAFLSQLITTDAVVTLHDYLVQWDVFTGDIDAFAIYLKDLWFTKFTRDGSADSASSGFENVFVGEISVAGTSVAGLNGWLNTYQLEQDSVLTYPGSGQDCADDLVSLDDYDWGGAAGGPSSLWIGKSPELQLSLLTVCYLARGIYGQNCNIEVNNGKAVKVVSASASGPSIDTISFAYFECNGGGGGTTTTGSGSTPPGGDFFECTEAIWAADNNSFTDAEFDYDLTGDVLFTSVDETRFSTGTYPTFIALLALFNPQLGIDDPDATAEVEAFLDQLMETGPIQAAYTYLNAWGYTTSLEDFRSQIQQYWFLKFSRGSPADSSGFEHVFQGEVREGGSEVTGMHGWVHVYNTEQEGNFQYGRSDLDCEDDLFQINDCVYFGAEKPITSIWVGLSPEVQLALYTACFITSRNQECDISVGGKRTSIVNYDMSGVSPTTVGTCYFGC